MTKPKRDVKFNHREARRPSQQIMADDSDDNNTATTAGTDLSRNRSNGGAKSTTYSNGGEHKSLRPSRDRTDTAATEGWTDDEKAPAPPPEQSAYQKKKQTFITRAIWTFVMIGIFFGSMAAGHIYVIIIVTAVQIISFKEVIAISNVRSRASGLRFTKTLNWYFLGSTMYFLYGESVIYYFKHIVLIDRVLLPFATHHRFISFMLYVMGGFNPQVTRKLQILTVCRLRLLCRLAPKRPLQVPIHAICLDAHGAVPDCRASALYHEQHL